MAIKSSGVAHIQFNGRIINAYPGTMLMWGSRASSTGNQTWMAQGQASSTARAYMRMAGGSDSKQALQVTAGGSTYGPNKSTSPHVSTTELRLFAGIFTNTTSRALYFGDANPLTDATGLSSLDNWSLHDTVTIGAQKISGAAASEIMNGSFAECHFFGVALTTANIIDLLAGTVKPEEIAGWIDGWTFAELSGDGSYPSMTGTRTATAVGTLETSTATGLPFTRTAGPATAAIAWTEGADAIAASVNVTIEGTAIAAAWTEGADVISIDGSVSTAIGTITTEPMVNNNDDPLSNETGVIANVYNAATGAFVVRKTGLTSDALGVVVISDALIVPGTSYSYEIVLTTNGRRLPVALAA